VRERNRFLPENPLPFKILGSCLLGEVSSSSIRSYLNHHLVAVHAVGMPEQFPGYGKFACLSVISGGHGTHRQVGLFYGRRFTKRPPRCEIVTGSIDPVYCSCKSDGTDARDCWLNIRGNIPTSNRPWVFVSNANPEQCQQTRHMP
jgi:hypothetical protein